MSKLKALHDPDMVAGGKDKTKRLGDRRVNSAIGGSWPSRIKAMDDAAKNALKTGGSDAKMNVKLEPCRK